MGVVLDRQQPFEISGHVGTVGRHSAQQRDGLLMILASSPLAEYGATYRIRRRDGSEDSKG